MARYYNNESSSKITAFTVFVISILLLVCLFGAFGSVGVAVSSFLMGVFGLSAYGLTVISALSSLAVLFGKCISASPAKVLKYILLYAVLILTLHVATSKEYLNESYFGYLMSCYSSNDTIGGLLAGLVTYFPAKVLSFGVALGIFGAMFLLLAFSSIFSEIGKTGRFKARKVNYSKRSELIEFDGGSQRARASVGHDLFVATAKERDSILNPKKQRDNNYDILYPKTPENIETQDIQSEVHEISRAVDRKQAARDALFSFQTSYNSYDFNVSPLDEKPSTATAFGDTSDNKTDNTRPEGGVPQQETTKSDKFDISSMLRYRSDTAMYTNNYYKDQLKNTSSDKVDPTNETQSFKSDYTESSARGNKSMSYSDKFSKLFDSSYNSDIPVFNSESDRVEEDSDTAVSEFASSVYTTSSDEQASTHDRRIDPESDYGTTQEKRNILVPMSNHIILDTPLYNDPLVEVYSKDKQALKDEASIENSDENKDIPEAKDTIDIFAPVKPTLEPNTPKYIPTEPAKTNYEPEVDKTDLFDFDIDDDEDEEIVESIVETKPTMENKHKVEPIPPLDEKVKPIEPISTPKAKSRLTSESIPVTEPKIVVDEPKTVVSRFAPITTPKVASKPVVEEETVVEEPKVKPYVKRAPYKAPPIELLKSYQNSNPDEEQENRSKIEILEQTMSNFGVNAEVKSITRGPSCTRFELAMPAGISVKKVTNLASDIAMNLEAQSVRIEAPIPGKNLVGVEVPNKYRSTVGFRNTLESNNSEFFTKESPLTFAIGMDIDGNSQIGDISKLPHVIIAGSTGSGKSVCINTLILSLIYKASPDDVRLLLIDPKRVELSIYNGLPHLLLKEIVTDPKKAVNALTWAVNEMDLRFELFQTAKVNSIKNYNEMIADEQHPKLPYIVIVIDEVADLMLTARSEVEEKILRLTALARAAGIHLIFATQRPSVDVITGTIKNNLPSRIAFAVSSAADSKTILGMGGAESLLGNGDMLYHPMGLRDPKRLQGPFVSQQEVSEVVKYVIDNNESIYDDHIEQFINHEEKENEDSITSTVTSTGDDFDPLLPKAVLLAIENKSASITMLQRKFSIGYSRACKIIDQMEARGYISKFNGSRARDVVITREEYKIVFPNVETDEALMREFGGDYD